MGGWKRKVPDKFLSQSAEETVAIGQKIAKMLQPGAVIALEGDLGAGKTTLIRGISAHCPDALVSSPTFTYLQIYAGSPPVFHFDLYRLSSSKEFLEKGFTDYLEQGGICCIEWAERIAELLPTQTLRIKLTYLSKDSREIALC